MECLHVRNGELPRFASLTLIHSDLTLLGTPVQLCPMCAGYLTMLVSSLCERGLPMKNPAWGITIAAVERAAAAERGEPCPDCNGTGLYAPGASCGRCRGVGAL